MEITYKKKNNTQLFKNLENKKLLNMNELSKLYSIYTKFFLH